MPCRARHAMPGVGCASCGASTLLLGFYRPSLAAPGSGVALEVLSDILAGAPPPPSQPPSRAGVHDELAHL